MGWIDWYWERAWFGFAVVGGAVVAFLAAAVLAWAGERVIRAIGRRR